MLWCASQGSGRNGTEYSFANLATLRSLSETEDAGFWRRKDEGLVLPHITLVGPGTTTSHWV